MSRDTSFRPSVPVSHTNYSWGLVRNPHHQYSDSSVSPALSSVTTTSHKTPNQNKGKSEQKQEKPKSQEKSTKENPQKAKESKEVKSSEPLNLPPPVIPPAERNPSNPRVTNSNPRLPQPGRRNFLITSALPYVNNVPHLGNLIGCVLSADVFSRYCQLRGINSIYICGTDEYGTATETKAIEAKMSEQALCDKYHTIHKEIYDWFEIDFDYFGRTTTKQQTEIAQDIFNKIDQNGYLLEDSVEQFYCEKDQRFLADRYIIGQCPHEDCHYEKAKGDQCDKCGRLLDAKDLINPRCNLCGQNPMVKNSNHLFLDLGRIQQERLQQWINEQQIKGRWTGNTQSIMKSWLEGGLKPRCITRDLKWGTPVPKDGFRNKVFYVWFDAPIGYISITANYTDQWRTWWQNPEQVELFQFMGKDNVPFHAAIFPSSCMATKENWTLLHHINTTEYLNYENTKFSKTNQTGVFGDDAKSTGIPAEVWRYYMLVNRPELSDTVFLWEDLQAKNNTELLNNLGNFCQRTLAFVKSKLEGRVPGVRGLAAVDIEFLTDVKRLKERYINELDQVQIKDALKTAMEMSSRANKYVQETGPWELIKENPERCFTIISINCSIIALLNALLLPFMPGFTSKLEQQLNWTVNPGEFDESIKLSEVINEASKESEIAKFLGFSTLPSGHVIGQPKPLFARIEDAQVRELKIRFAGKQESKEGKPFPLDIRVGIIKSADDHKENEKLVICQVDLGEGKDRQIVGGLKPHYTAQELIGKRVAVLTNLKKSKFKGVESDGLIFTAVKNKTSLLVVGGNAPAGTPIIPRTAQIAAKPNFDLRNELKKLELETGEDGIARFGDLEWLCGGAEVKADNGIPAAKIQ
jgi:methionyl-tRNA synthetase